MSKIVWAMLLVGFALLAGPTLAATSELIYDNGQVSGMLSQGMFFAVKFQAYGVNVTAVRAYLNGAGNYSGTLLQIEIRNDTGGLLCSATHYASDVKSGGSPPGGWVELPMYYPCPVNGDFYVTISMNNPQAPPGPGNGVSLAYSMGANHGSYMFTPDWQPYWPTDPEILSHMPQNQTNWMLRAVVEGPPASPTSTVTTTLSPGLALPATVAALALAAIALSRREH